MEVAVELDDDLFFAELSKRISLLIMDDDDEDPITRYPSISFQTYSGANHPTGQSPYFQEQICRREMSKGTGVFIPRSLQPRRKHRQARYTSFTAKSNRQHDQCPKWFPKHLTIILFTEGKAKDTHLYQVFTYYERNY